MNYRHAFHAGNFADVVKHAVLARIVAHLQKKEAPFRVIDTHAGAGRYNLQSGAGARSGEWRDGIGRVLAHRFAAPAAALLEPYRAAIEAFNPEGRLKIYPGSPLLVRRWLRAQDRLLACELEPGAAQALARNLRGDDRVKAIAIDGWTASMAYIPPKERRGLVLIDPPFEDKDELQRMSEALAAVHRKWRSGILLAWYPIKSEREIASFVRTLPRLEPEISLRIELVRAPDASDRLRGTGLICINPPFALADECRLLLPALAKAFWPTLAATYRVAPIAGARS